MTANKLADKTVSVSLEFGEMQQTGQFDVPLSVAVAYFIQNGFRHKGQSVINDITLEPFFHLTQYQNINGQRGNKHMQITCENGYEQTHYDADGFLSSLETIHHVYAYDDYCGGRVHVETALTPLIEDGVYRYNDVHGFHFFQGDQGQVTLGYCHDDDRGDFVSETIDAKLKAMVQDVISGAASANALTGYQENFACLVTPVKRVFELAAQVPQQGAAPKQTR